MNESFDRKNPNVEKNRFELKLSQKARAKTPPIVRALRKKTFASLQLILMSSNRRVDRAVTFGTRGPMFEPSSFWATGVFNRCSNSSLLHHRHSGLKYSLFWLHKHSTAEWSHPRDQGLHQSGRYRPLMSKCLTIETVVSWKIKTGRPLYNINLQRMKTLNKHVAPFQSFSWNRILVKISSPGFGFKPKSFS